MLRPDITGYPVSVGDRVAFCALLHHFPYHRLRIGRVTGFEEDRVRIVHEEQPGVVTAFAVESTQIVVIHSDM